MKITAFVIALIFSTTVFSQNTSPNNHSGIKKSSPPVDTSVAYQFNKKTESNIIRYREPSEKAQTKYCEISGTALSVLFSWRRDINVNLGKEKNNWDDNKFTHPSGKEEVFNSLLEVVNFMASKGWTVVSAYAIKNSEQENEYHYVMEKRAYN